MIEEGLAMAYAGTEALGFPFDETRPLARDDRKKSAQPLLQPPFRDRGRCEFHQGLLYKLSRPEDIPVADRARPSNDLGTLLLYWM